MAGELDPLVALHLKQTNDHIADIRTTLVRMSESLSTLVRVEQQQRDHEASIGRAHAAIDDHETRMQAVEREIPMLRQTHGWVVTGVLGIIALVGLTLWQFVLAPRQFSPPSPTSVTAPGTR